MRQARQVNAIRRYAAFVATRLANENLGFGVADPRTQKPAGLVPLSLDEERLIDDMLASAADDDTPLDLNAIQPMVSRFYAANSARIISLMSDAARRAKVGEIVFNPAVVVDSSAAPAAGSVSPLPDEATPLLATPAPAAAPADAAAAPAPAPAAPADAAAEAAAAQQREEELKKRVILESVQKHLQGKLFKREGEIPELMPAKKGEKKKPEYGPWANFGRYVVIPIFAVVGMGLLIAGIVIGLPMWLPIAAVLLGIAGLGVTITYAWARGSRETGDTPAKARMNRIKGRLSRILGIAGLPMGVLSIMGMILSGSVTGGFVGMGAAATFLGAHLALFAQVLGMTAAAAAAVTPVGWVIIAIVALVLLSIAISIVVPMIVNSINYRINQSLPKSVIESLGGREGSEKALINTVEGALKETVTALKAWRKSTDPGAGAEIARLTDIIAELRGGRKGWGGFFARLKASVVDNPIDPVEMRAAMQNGLEKFNAWRSDPTKIATTVELATITDNAVKAEKAAAAAAATTAARPPAAAPSVLSTPPAAAGARTPAARGADALTPRTSSASPPAAAAAHHPSSGGGAAAGAATGYDGSGFSAAAVAPPAPAPTSTSARRGSAGREGGLPRPS